MQYDALISGHLMEVQSRYYKQHGMGKTFEVKLLGKTGFFTTDPVNLHAILITHFEGQSPTPFPFQTGLTTHVLRRAGFFPLTGEGIFTQDGEPWRHSREIPRRQFVRMQYQDLKIFQGPLDELLAELESAPSGIVDLQPFFFRFTLHTTTALIFSEPSAGLTPADHERFGSSFNHASLTTAMRTRLANRCWLYVPSEFKKSCQVLKRHTMHYVSHALKDLNENGAGASERRPFIVNLYQELRDPELVRDQLMNVLLAGRDTTACLMSWAFHLLVRHPEVLAKLRQEISSLAPASKAVTRAQINKMTYLKCVLNETNRLYAVVPVNVRVAIKTTTLPRGGGPDGRSPLLIRRGRPIGFAPYHMHRDPDIYGDDANEFRPERWEGEKLKNVGLGFMPFHGGPRLCLGKDFALMEASCGIVCILQTFPGIRLPPGWATVPSGQEKQNISLVLSSGDGCSVVLEKTA